LIYCEQNCHPFKSDLLGAASAASLLITVENDGKPKSGHHHLGLSRKLPLIAGIEEMLIPNPVCYAIHFMVGDKMLINIDCSQNIIFFQICFEIALVWLSNQQSDGGPVP